MSCREPLTLSYLILRQLSSTWLLIYHQFTTRSVRFVAPPKAGHSLFTTTHAPCPVFLRQEQQQLCTQLSLFSLSSSHFFFVPLLHSLFLHEFSLSPLGVLGTVLLVNDPNVEWIKNEKIKIYKTIKRKRMRNFSWRKA